MECLELLRFLRSVQGGFRVSDVSDGLREDTVDFDGYFLTAEPYLHESICISVNQRGNRGNRIV